MRVGVILGDFFEIAAKALSRASSGFILLERPKKAGIARNRGHRFFSVMLPCAFIFGCLSGLTGCATPSIVAIEDVMTPYTTLKNLIKSAMPQGVVRESVNGREMISGYFTPNNFYESGDTKVERVSAKVLVLGSSRPFRVEIQCLREKRAKENGKATYIAQGEDVRLSKQLAQYFRDALADRREDRSLIDDFRPF